jgi:hypothetical protein
MGPEAMNEDAHGRLAATPAAIDAVQDPHAAGDAALSAIGYEAADPSLLAPFWGDELQAGPMQRRLR